MSLLALGVAATAAGARRATTTNTYGHPSCEYLAAEGTLPNLTANVWNTYGLNAWSHRHPVQDDLDDTYQLAQR